MGGRNPTHFSLNKDMTHIHRIYNQTQLVKIHQTTIFNKKSIKNKNHACGCFSCLQTFDSSLITKTCDNNQTALCPFCEIDSVIHETRTRKVTDSLLTQMYNRYFSYIDNGD